MICARCGSTMNHHADKPLPGDLDARVEELYACPGCGASAARRAGAASAAHPGRGRA